ncbi:ABC transporter ATP-binding protein [Amphritea sp. 2_MG-2023]|uniref:ABC transporter ATP-binding protein n=1 Tax=Amphritea TaxID=515417 RepID=UPI001C067077|nr:MULTISPECIES: ABC transporter ATP-binding protein [Amphritea]MBU2964617.1 ABC transporter ATP-binding protein/permease [Amphritea atlantica]MDO6417946.1 ABC transporter ATP-binding protein [Amphritea sp. 2_MG-2023]
MDESLISATADIPTQRWRSRLWPYRWVLAALLLCQLGQVTAALLLPRFSADLIDEGIVAQQTDSIVFYGSAMGVAALVQLVLSAIAVFLGASMAFHIARDLRADVFAKVHNLSLAQVQSFSVGSLITRCTNDVLQVQTMLTMTLTMIVIAPIMAVGGAVMAVRQDLQLSLILLVIVPLLALILGVLTYLATPLFQQMQRQLDGVNAILREQITGIRVIRAFLQEPREAKRFRVANIDLTDTATRAGRLGAMTMPSLTAMMQLGSVALIWFGSDRVLSSDLLVGGLIAFMSYMALILISVMMMGMLMVMLPRALVSARRIDTLLRTPVTVASPVEPMPLPVSPEGLTLRFENVGFGYPGAESMVLENISFEVAQGEVLGIIGATGSGKTTIVNLIARLDDPSTGRITLGGIDLRDLTSEALAKQIGYVPQKAYLFSGSVAQTLRLGDPSASETALWQALETAQAADFIRALPKGLQAPVAQGGVNFSGGQCQRLAIARALVCQPTIFLFDDSFSALDQTTDARLRTALRNNTENTTRVIVSQRVASIRDADRILVLSRGRIAGLGSHDELMRHCTIYADIVASQDNMRGVA